MDHRKREHTGGRRGGGGSGTGGGDAEEIRWFPKGSYRTFQDNVIELDLLIPSIRWLQIVLLG